MCVFLLTTRLWHYGVDGPLTNAIDFRAFYCAGSALDAGRDPYLVEPVRSCERAALAIGGFSFAEKDVYVAPYPPIVLAGFAAIALLPYRLAVELWMTLGIASLCVAIVLAARLTTLRPLYVALAFVASVGFASFFYGQPVPLAIAALLFAALAARVRRGTLVALGLAVASVQPHLALAAWVGAAILVPVARRPLAVAACAAAVVSLAFYAHLTLEYVTVVVPMHARSEVGNFAGQYGLPALLRFCGAPIAAALRAGTVWYVAMLAVGVYVARRLDLVFDDAAFAVLAPVALVTIGGPFVHAHQIAAALPFALLLFARARARVSTSVAVALGIAIVALAIPWQIIADEPGVDQFFPHRAYVKPPPFRVPAADEQIDRSYTERQDALSQSNERTPAIAVAWKLPTWFALITLFAIALGVSRLRAVRGFGSA